MRQGTRILIVTDAFVPPMQGTRMRNLVTNLQQFGYECRLVCEAVDSSVLPIGMNIMPFRYLIPETSRFRRWFNMLLRLADKLFLLKEKRMERFLERTIDFESIDVILSSAYLFPVRCVSHVAERHHIPYIMDLRDIVEQWNSLDYLNYPHNSHIAHRIAARYLRLATTERNRALNVAKAVVSVSEWHVNTLRAYHPNVHLIYNGYDEQQFYFIPQPSDHFRITYTGKIYNLSLRDPELLFAALHSVIQKHILPIEDIELRFYIEPEAADIIQDLAARYQLEQALHILPFVGSNEINNVLAQSSIVLILNNPGTEKSAIHGVLPTKFYEAIGAEKPVLCIPADHDCLQQLTEETRAGISSDNPQEIEDYLYEKYTEWQKQGYTRQMIYPEQKRRFTRQYQALQFAQLIQDALE